MRWLISITLLSCLLGADLQLSILGRQTITCPVCKQDFTTIVCTQTNARAGVDRDLFARALGPQPEFYRISTCPTCGYSGYGSDFDPELHIPPDVISRILKEPRLQLPADFNPKSDPRMLDASDRYALAIQCYRWRGKSDEALAWLNLRASWIARENGAMLPPGDRLARVMRYIERWRPLLDENGNQADVEMRLATRVAEALADAQFNRYQKPYVQLSLLLILRRHGENRQARPLLERLRPYPDFSDAIRESLERMSRSIDAEQQHQAQAAKHFEQAILADEVSTENKPVACYLLGELNRRLGRDALAIQWYNTAIATPGLDRNLLAWAREQRTVCQARPVTAAAVPPRGTN